MAKLIEDSQVFTAAVDVLLAKGYVGATTKMMAEAAGINEATLFRKYGSKAQLVSAALLHERQALTRDAIRYTGDLTADLTQMVRLYTDASPRQSALILLLMTEIVRHPELRDTMQIPYMLVSHFGQIIARYQQEGQLKAGDPILVTGTLLGPIVVNGLLSRVDSGLPIPPIDLAEHVEKFLRGNAV